MPAAEMTNSLLGPFGPSSNVSFGWNFLKFRGEAIEQAFHFGFVSRIELKHLRLMLNEPFPKSDLSDHRGHPCSKSHFVHSSIFEGSRCVSSRHGGSAQRADSVSEHKGRSAMRVGNVERPLMRESLVKSEQMA